MSALPDAPATSRNREPILDALQDPLADSKSVLEIGSGTGQHAVYFAEHLPALVWQTSDVAENHDDIRAWLHAAALPNLRAPLPLNVLQDDDPPGRYDAVFSANTSHIMGVDAVAAMFALVGRILPANGPFCLYGPFRIDERFTSDSNASFDASLRARDPAMGIRDLAFLDDLGRDAGLVRESLLPMPANNFLAVWRKTATAA